MADQIDTTFYLNKIRKELEMHFTGILNEQKPAIETKSRLEGFMRAGVVLGITSNNELKGLMEEIHLNIFGESIAERKARKKAHWPEISVDYGQFETPSYLRMNQEQGES